MSLPARPAVAVALHDVEPRTFVRVREIRVWLRERGIARATLLVIPAPQERPFADDAPRLPAWLCECAARGDAVAQHGLTHRRACLPRGPRGVLAQLQGGAGAEFPGRDAAATAESVQLGRRLLAQAGVEPHGFVAPGYAYTRALRRTLAGLFAWWADLRGVWIGGRRLRARALTLGASTAPRRALTPPLVRAAASLPLGPLMRVDVHPADFDLPGHVATLEWLLDRACDRVPVTYDELAR